jgi:hypothetical protein
VGVVRWQHTVLYDGGFATLGEITYRGGLAHAAAHVLRQYVLYVALPDGRSALYADLVRAGCDLTLLSQEGFRLNLANDLFNGSRRRVRFDGGIADLVAGEPTPASLLGNPSRWLAVDELLGVQFIDGVPGTAQPRQSRSSGGTEGMGASWTVRTFPQRHAPNKSLYYAVLCRPLHSSTRAVQRGEVIQRTCARFIGTVLDGEWVAPASCVWDDESVPASEVQLPGLDGRSYAVSASWAERTVALSPRTL